jgi:hypothetical protein
VTAGPQVRSETVRKTGFDGSLVTGMIVNVKVTPITAEGMMGMLLSRTYAILEDGIRELTASPLENIVTSSVLMES